jgi:hypothetical protein
MPVLAEKPIRVPSGRALVGVVETAGTGGARAANPSRSTGLGVLLRYASISYPILSANF